MNRREFLVGSAAMAVVACRPCPPGSNTARAPLEPVQFDARYLPAIPARLRDDMILLLRWLVENGWFAMLAWPDPPTDPLDQALFDARSPEIRAVPGFEDFAGVRAIHPGRPELSLLYHALASPRVTLGRYPGAPVLRGDYPNLDQLDTLENFIYALRDVAIMPGDEARHALAVLAYEYRPARSTPHGVHADLVFSRTGIARIGSESRNYEAERRCFSNRPRGGSDRAFAVTAARYGLFVVRKASRNEVALLGIDERHDCEREFVVPERKLFSGDLLIGGGRIAFGERHRNEKLFRLATHRPDGKTPLLLAPHVDLRRPPFWRESQTKPGEGNDANDARLVELTAAGSSAIVSSTPAALVRPATQNGVWVRFRVPPTGGSVSRYYTSLEILEHKRRDAFFSGLASLFRPYKPIPLRAPRNVPMFVNIRHELVDHRPHPVHLDLPDGCDKIYNGGYWAALFDDNLCDGCVVAEVTPGPRDRLPAALDRRVVPAFSIITAPDFFPLVDGRDLDEDPRLSDNFFKGGTTALSAARVRANPTLRVPHVERIAFADEPSEHAFESAVAQTVTAVVSRPPHPVEPSAVATTWDRARTGFLPDTASAVFYPGYDVTYSSAPDYDGVYLATYALGAPFAEDLKLCAAANGMWPAASPDGARSYQGSLTAIPVLGSYFSRTATPLLDHELGVHPRSPAVTDHGQASVSGWDGDYGPFLEVDGSRVWVNFADIRQVDHVQNMLADRFDASRLRDLKTHELVARMDALRRCIAEIDGGQKVYRTPLWLVSLESVREWSNPASDDGARGVGIPTALWGPVTWATSPRPRVTGSGFLFVFAYPHELANGDVESIPLDSADPRRLRRVCKSLYVCQVTATTVAWCRWDPESAPRALAWQ